MAMPLRNWEGWRPSARRRCGRRRRRSWRRWTRARGCEVSGSSDRVAALMRRVSDWNLCRRVVASPRRGPFSFTGVDSIKERDPRLRWSLPDRVFFACGACHILVYAFLERCGMPDERMVWLKPDAGFTGTMLSSHDRCSCRTPFAARRSPRRQVDPGQVAALAGAGVEEHRAAAALADADIGAAIGAAPVVAAIDGEAGGDAVDPAQAALGIAVALGAPGRLAEEARERTPWRGPRAAAAGPRRASPVWKPPWTNRSAGRPAAVRTQPGARPISTAHAVARRGVELLEWSRPAPGRG